MMIFPWMMFFGVGLYAGFLRFYCANPVPYDPVTNHPYTCTVPYNLPEAIGILVVVIGIPSAASLSYWKFGFPRDKDLKPGESVVRTVTSRVDSK